MDSRTFTKTDPKSEEDLSQVFEHMSLLTKDLQQDIEKLQGYGQYFAETEKEDSDVDEDKEDAATESAYRKEIERVLEDTMWTKKQKKHQPAALARELFKALFKEDELKTKTLKELDKGRRSLIRDAIFKKFSVPEEARYYYWIGIQQSVSQMVSRKKEPKSARRSELK